MIKFKCIDEGTHIPFVVISRQAGAGGHLLAEALLDAMKQERHQELFSNWSVFDAKECQAMLEEARFRVTFPWLRNEIYRTNLGDFFYQVFGYQSPQMDVMARIFNTVRHRAKQGKVIFIGRGAVALTQHMRKGIRVRLIAPLSERIENVATANQISRNQARDLILRRDRARAWLLRHYFHRNIDDPSLYHAIWNTALVPVSEIARFLIDQIQRAADQKVDSLLKLG